MIRTLLVLACAVILVLSVSVIPLTGSTTFTSPPGRVYLPILEQPPWIDDPAKGIAGYLPRGESETQRHHYQHQWNLTCSADEDVNCINHLKKRSVMADLYPDRPDLLVETLIQCSGGEFWYGDEFNLYDQTRWPLSQWVEEAHWIRSLFDEYAPDGCLFGFGVPLIGSGWWGREADEWIAAFDALYRETYGEPLALDIYLVDDYYRGPETYRETVATHALIRSLYGEDVQIVAREWGCMAEGGQQLALDYACQTGWHKLYDGYYWFIGKARPGTTWAHTALYVDGMTDVGKAYAAFPSWYCGLQWEYWR